MTIKDLQPTIVWNNFYGLTQCPRPSKHEEAAREFILNWAKERGIDARADETGNVIISVPATPGYENRKGVILQVHMDMVPQKTADKVHDFLTDPIETIIEGDWVTADRTTLGADNGMGVALAMAVAESKDLKHGPVEILVTYDEETGMTGAKALKPGVLKGELLLSGMDISLYRANANKVLANALIPVMEKYGAKLVSFNGGSLRNAIPFEGEAEIVVPAERAAATVRTVKKNFAEVTARYKESDPAMSCNIERTRKPAAEYIEEGVALNAMKAVSACPSNVIRMSRSMPGLTETSINLAVVRTGRGHIKVASLLRSAVDESKAELANRVRYIFEFAGASVKFSGGYSGWIPRPDTPMIAMINDIHQKLFGKPMNILATHGGLECALLGAKYPHWQMVSMGPTVLYPHSPDERVNIPSVQHVWDLLKAVLEAVPEK